MPTTHSNRRSASRSHKQATPNARSILQIFEPTGTRLARNKLVQNKLVQNKLVQKISFTVNLQSLCDEMLSVLYLPASCNTDLSAIFKRVLSTRPVASLLGGAVKTLRRRPCKTLRRRPCKTLRRRPCKTLRRRPYKTLRRRLRGGGGGKDGRMLLIFLIMLIQAIAGLGQLILDNTAYNTYVTDITTAMNTPGNILEQNTWGSCMVQSAIAAGLVQATAISNLYETQFRAHTDPNSDIFYQHQVEYYEHTLGVEISSFEVGQYLLDTDKINNARLVEAAYADMVTGFNIMFPTLPNGQHIILLCTFYTRDHEGHAVNAHFHKGDNAITIYDFNNKVGIPAKQYFLNEFNTQPAGNTWLLQLYTSSSQRIEHVQKIADQNTRRGIDQTIGKNALPILRSADIAAYNTFSDQLISNPNPEVEVDLLQMRVALQRVLNFLYNNLTTPHIESPFFGPTWPGHDNSETSIARYNYVWPRGKPKSPSNKPPHERDSPGAGLPGAALLGAALLGTVAAKYLDQRSKELIEANSFNEGQLNAHRLVLTTR